MASTGRMEDPLITFQFRIEVDGPIEISGFFTEVSGIGSESEVVEVKTTSRDGKAELRKVPGRMKWQDITLKRGITSDMGIWEWRKLVEDGDVERARANCSITMMNTRGEDVARWDIESAWPSKVTGPAPKSDANEFGIEEMVIVHEGLWRRS